MNLTYLQSTGHPKNVVHGMFGSPASFASLACLGAPVAALVEKVALQGVVEGHGVLVEGVGIRVGFLGHVNAAVAGRVLAHLLDSSWALRSFADPSRRPFVSAHVHDVLDHEANADGHLLVVGSLL